jgi:hypothetical protein
MDVEKTIEFLLEHQARFEVRMAELTDKMDLMVDQQIGMEERHDREMAEIRASLRQAVRLSVEEQRRERVRRQALDTKVDKVATSLHELIEAMKKDRNGH